MENRTSIGGFDFLYGKWRLFIIISWGINLDRDCWLDRIEVKIWMELLVGLVEVKVWRKIVNMIEREKWNGNCRETTFFSHQNQQRKKKICFPLSIFRPKILKCVSKSFRFLGLLGEKGSEVRKCWCDYWWDFWRNYLYITKILTHPLKSKSLQPNALNEWLKLSLCRFACNFELRGSVRKEYFYSRYAINWWSLKGDSISKFGNKILWK